MRAAFRPLVLGFCRLGQDAGQPLRGESELGEGQAAVEHFPVQHDFAIAQGEAAHALEQYRPAFRAFQTGGVAEAPLRVAILAIADRGDEFPPIVPPAIVEMLQHPGDGRAALVWAEEAVIVDAIGCEQGGQPCPVIGLNGGREALQQSGEIHVWLLRSN